MPPPGGSAPHHWHPSAMSTEAPPLLACAVVTDDAGFDPLTTGIRGPDTDRQVVRMSPAEWSVAKESGPIDLLVLDGRAGAAYLVTPLAGVKRRHPAAGALCIGVASIDEAVALLAAGADVALTSDASPAIVDAHVDAAVRRAAAAAAQLRMRFGDLVYEREARRVWCAEQEVQLTPCELRLFDILFQRAGAPVSANTLYDYVWHDEPHSSGSSNSLAVYVRYLRRKLEGSKGIVVETLRGRGYRLSKR